MVAVKDYPTLVRAFIRLAGRVQDPAGLRLLLVGDGAAGSLAAQGCARAPLESDLHDASPRLHSNRFA